MALTNALIVGASLAGIRAAETLRRDGFDGPIAMVGDELHRPYDRPPLSKQVLAGEWAVERTALLEDDAVDGLELDWHLGRRATRLDLSRREVELDDGALLGFDGAIVATGARPRTIPTGGLTGIHTLRTMDDAMAIRAGFEAGPRVVVVGAGFIGAEVAATARMLGLDVTLVEAAPAPMERGLGRELGMVCADLHRDHGVDLRLGVGVEGFEGTGRVEAVRLSDDSTVPADLVVVGIGVVPNTDWLEGSGLTIDNGVLCDETCLAATGVVAAGDVARWPNRRFGEVMRVEHWDNAVEQGVAAARRLLVGEGAGTPFEPVPWFWSDQYDRKIQLAGRPNDADEVTVVTGAIDERRFAALYRRGDRLAAVFGMNRPRHVMQYRQLIADGASWDAALESASS